MTARPDDAKVLRELLTRPDEDVIEDAARVSVAQAERELAAAGVDVAASRAKAAAILERLGGSGEAKRAVEAKSGDDAAIERAGWVTKADVPPSPPEAETKPPVPR